MGMLYGYARASSDEQVLTIPGQKERIEVKADTMDGEFVHTRHDVASAEKIAWTDRPELKKLCQELRRGDTLIVWNVERLDRDMWRAADCCRWLDQRGVSLCLLEFMGMELDLNESTNKFFLFMFMGIAELFRGNRIKAVRHGVRRVKEAGFIPAPHTVAMGHRVVKVIVGPELKPRRQTAKKDGKYIRYRQEWCPEQCAIIREIWVRHYVMKQTDRRIGRDFQARELVTGDGVPWVQKRQPKHRERPSNDCKRIATARLRMNRWIKEDKVPIPLQLNKEIIARIVAEVNARESGSA